MSATKKRPKRASWDRSALRLQALILQLADGRPIEYRSSAGECLLVWQDGRGGNWDIYGQRVAVGGVLTGSNFAISSLTGDETLPSIAWDGWSGRYLVGWQG